MHTVRGFLPTRQFQNPKSKASNCDDVGKKTAKRSVTVVTIVRSGILTTKDPERTSIPRAGSVRSLRTRFFFPYGSPPAPRTPPRKTSRVAADEHSVANSDRKFSYCRQPPLGRRKKTDSNFTKIDGTNLGRYFFRQRAVKLVLRTHEIFPASHVDD
ncbi:hypothetical protein GWI33_006171 [Rhynchophorus ferrugineus]|uniref:Uncharacterized protein n=1 Tax=Rhynchophorus ferrugineus TaxID=354439 RepID=A0A834IS51_RHYFE|nr:hypothetical protein GWI33_006171 [Rhynchophorus ferrugineus]